MGDPNLYIQVLLNDPAHDTIFAAEAYAEIIMNEPFMPANGDMWAETFQGLAKRSQEGEMGLKRKALTAFFMIVGIMGLNEYGGNIGYLPPDVARQIQATVDEVGLPLYIVGGATYKRTFYDIDYAASGSAHRAYWKAWNEGRLPRVNPNTMVDDALTHPPFPLDSPSDLDVDLGVIEFRPNQPPIYHKPKYR